MCPYSVEELRAIIAPIARKYGVSRVFLFGSTARGTAGRESDIDLRVEKGQLKGAFALCGLYTELEDALQTPIDLLTTGGLSEEFLQEIRKDEVLLYEQ